MLSTRLPLALDAAALEDLPPAPDEVDLSCGNPTRCGLAPSADLLPPTPFDWAAPYTPHPFGAPAAREALAAALGTMGQRVAADDLVLCASTSEAFAFLFKLVGDPGAAVAVGRPGYPLVQHLAELEGLRPLVYASHFDGSAWRLHLPSVAAAIAQGARAVSVISPNNPTGARIHPDDVVALARLCNPAGVLCIFDEVFAPYGWAPQPNSAFVPLQGFARAVSLGGLSKAACLPQAKLSWIALGGAPSFRAQAKAGLAWIADAALSLGGPVQQALPAICAAMPAVQAQVRARVAENLARLQAWARAGPGGVPRGRLLPGEAGWYAVLTLPGVDVAALEAPLQRAGVRLQPASLFDLPLATGAVVGLILPPERLALGLRRLGAVAGAHEPTL